MSSLEARLLLTSHRQEAMLQREKVHMLRSQVENLYKGTEKRLPFHGWQHVQFVAQKGREFATVEQQRLLARKKITSIDHELPYYVEAICLVHDLNNLVETVSPEHIGENLRRQILQAVGYNKKEIQRMEAIIQYREKGSFIAHCFQDADDAAKFDPELRKLTDNTFTQEQSISRATLARNIVTRQLLPILEKKRPIFHTSIALEQYGVPAVNDLQFWWEEYYRYKRQGAYEVV